MVKGQIRQSLSGYYDIFTEDGVEYRTRARGNFRKRKLTPLVGDFVEFKAENQQEGYILKIYPRKNELVRPPVANTDVAVVVTASTEPTFSSNLLDRQLIMLAHNHIEPVLYFSKADLLDEAELAKMQEIVAYYNQYYGAYIPFEDQKFVAQHMFNEFEDQVIVIMGQTGAGKSTLLNTLKPELALETGEISKALSRGKHTTRKVTLLPIGKNLIADTPGFSSFDLLEITKEELPLYYPDFVQYQDECKYRGCLHVKEPHCAVKQAVAEGKILQSRYDNYLQFHEMIINQKPKYK